MMLAGGVVVYKQDIRSMHFSRLIHVMNDRLSALAHRHQHQLALGRLEQRLQPVHETTRSTGSRARGHGARREPRRRRTLSKSTREARRLRALTKTAREARRHGARRDRAGGTRTLAGEARGNRTGGLRARWSAAAELGRAHFYA